MTLKVIGGLLVLPISLWFIYMFLGMVWKVLLADPEMCIFFTIIFMACIGA